LEAERLQAFEYNTDTKKFENLKNMIYDLKDHFNLTPDKSLNKNKTSKQQTVKTNDDKTDELVRGADFVSSVTTGRYGLKKGSPSQQMVTSTSVPYSDEEGYKVIGSFKYGRGIIVKPGLIPELICDPSSRNDLTADQLEQQRQAMMITNISTVADEEANAIGNYFRVNKPNNIESLIPPYLDMDSEIYKEKVDEIILPYEEDAAAIAATGALVAGAGSTSSDKISEKNEKIKQGL
jgi:hypothetical protein